MTMPDTTETRDVDWEHVAKHGLAKCTPEHTWAEWLADRNAEIERLGEDLERAYQKDDAKTIEINILVPENRRLAAEIDRLSRELLEAKEALAHYDHFLIDLTEDFIGSFDGAELQDMLVANGLYVIEDFDPAKHHDWSGAAEPGDNFYTPSDVVLKARSVLSPKKEVSRERETG